MKKITIIAEAGINHNKNFNYAKKMIKIAAQSGANIVKFQTAIPEKLLLMSEKKQSIKVLIQARKMKVS